MDINTNNDYVTLEPWITVHGMNMKHGMRVHLNYLTDSLDVACEKVREYHPDVRVTGATLHLPS